MTQTKIELLEKHINEIDLIELQGTGLVGYILSAMSELEAEVRKEYAQPAQPSPATSAAPELLEALVKSVEVIKQWHGAEVFDIYYNHAPEMKPIREAITKNNGGGE